MITLCAAENTEEDARQAFEWRNDRETVRASYIALPKSWESFWMEFSAWYFSVPELCPCFVLKNGKKAGFVHFEAVEREDFPSGTAAEVMINIDPKFRRKGIGTKALRKIKKLMKSRGIRALVADVRNENKASRRLFEKAGFEIFSKRKEFIEITREKCNILCYRCILT